jgi:hypothetical protein
MTTGKRGAFLEQELLAKNRDFTNNPEILGIATGLQHLE